MSRVSTPFSEAGEDAFLPSIEQDDALYGGYRNPFDGNNTATFSSTFDKHILDDLNLGLDDGLVAPTNSRAMSGMVTPNYGDNIASPEIDFEEYSFEQAQRATSVYPGPDELNGETHSFLVQLHTPHGVYQGASKRSLPYQSNTNGNMRYAAGPLQNFNQAHHTAHRRSWSQSDTERLVDLPLDQYPPHVRHEPPGPHSQAPSKTNPTFVRLCEMRHSRSTSKSSEYKKPHHAQGRAGNRGTANPPTSMPVGIGIPLPPDPRIVPTVGNIQLTGPRMVHMSHGEQRKTSQRIIEVGAMAVVSKAMTKDKMRTVDPLLLEEEARMRDKSNAPSPEVLVGGSEPREKMLKDLDKMERSS